MKLNKAELNKLAMNVANQGDSLETDVAQITDEDDIQAALSHVDILATNVQRLKDALRAMLEG